MFLSCFLLDWPYRSLIIYILYNNSAQPVELYVRVGILHYFSKREGLGTSFILPLCFNDLYQTRKVSGHVPVYVCVSGISFLSTIFQLDFGTVRTVWYFFFFHFILYIQYVCVFSRFLLTELSGKNCGTTLLTPVQILGTRCQFDMFITEHSFQ